MRDVEKEIAAFIASLPNGAKVQIVEQARGRLFLFPWRAKAKDVAEQESECDGLVKPS